ncbi:hypothetical protein HYH03_004110 [Edaphochlamys debaryana]|uniref:DNA polymerase II subunit 2 n=1 Tax=Edaphochlamys debaryana TaxID=47281 RepID=A0A835YAQ9_9CHLO|nr:hypothetical protein HYH03_004110 [Edaphochlamys debaryana]|eukprot:KAG2497843.1 hypothetical protein HYH03_004110 [Edaphochlamys debaryana]
MSFALKKQIKKELLASDWAGKVEEAAVATLATIIEERHGGQLDALHDILRNCTTELSADGKITPASVQAAVAPAGTSQQVELIEVTDAFSVPRLVYDAVQRKLNVDSRPRSIHATVEAKLQVYLQRLLLIQQRLQRNRMFMQSNLLLPSSSNQSASVQLTDLQSLKGVFGVTRYVLGCISRAEDGRYVLEDTTGSVKLDLSAAMTAAGFYTENCVVIAEGALGHDGAFHVRALGLPPVEPRSALPLAAQRLNTWGGAGGAVGPDSEAGCVLALEEAQRGASERVVVLANVWLDRPEVLDSLNTIFNGFSGVPTVPAVFVLMGNFHSRAGAASGAAARGAGRAGAGGEAMLGGCDVDYGVMKELFGQLAALIDQYPRLRTESRFVLMPGPDDPGPGPILPQPPLPRCLTGELRRLLPTAVFGSNPCRLRFATQRIVLFRHDLMRRLRRRALLPLSVAPEGTTDPTQASQAAAASSGPSPSALWGHLSLTLLQQSHLAPLPLLAQPVYWEHDGALGLYPLPDCVVLADASAGAQGEFVHEGCRVINPGCLPGGFFAAYLPCVQQVEMSELPRPGAEAEALGGEEDEAAAGMGDGEQEGGELRAERRVPLAQRQPTTGAAAGGKQGKAKPAKPRAPRGSGKAAGGKGRPAKAAAAGSEPADVAAEAGADEPGAADVDMADQAAADAAAPAEAAAKKPSAKAKGGKAAAAAAAAAAKGGPRQGTLAMAWAKQPAAVREIVDLEDAEDEGADGGEDVDMEEAEEEAKAAAQRRRRQQAARKRRAVLDEDDEEEEDGPEGEEAGGHEGAGGRALVVGEEDDE